MQGGQVGGGMDGLTGASPGPQTGGTRAVLGSSGQPACVSGLARLGPVAWAWALQESAGPKDERLQCGCPLLYTQACPAQPAEPRPPRLLCLLPSVFPSFSSCLCFSLALCLCLSLRVSLTRLSTPVSFAVSVSLAPSPAPARGPPAAPVRPLRPASCLAQSCSMRPSWPGWAGLGDTQLWAL